jgi:hypothetical protein
LNTIYVIGPINIETMMKKVHRGQVLRSTSKK